MSWITVIWSLNAGVCLALAGVHVGLWIRERASWMNFWFSLACTAVAATGVIELALMHAPSPAVAGELLRWVYVPIGVGVVSVVWFAHFYLRAGRLWLAWLITGLRGLFLVMNSLMTPNMMFRDITGLKEFMVLGEIVSAPVGVKSAWAYLPGLTTLLPLVFIIDAAFTAWRAGRRRPALAIVLALGSVFIVGGSFATLLARGTLPLPFMVSVEFSAVLLVMGYELSMDLWRASRLSHELRESQERMNLATSAVDLGVWEWDVQKDEIWATEKSRGRAGVGPGERLNLERFLQALHPEDRERTHEAVRRAVQGGESLEVEYRMIASDGTTHWIAARGELERKGEGEPRRLRGVSLDITNRKRAELEVQELRDNLTQVSRTVTVAALSGSLAHELNQPLGIILSNAQAAQQLLDSSRPDLAEVREILADIVAADRRAAGIIEGLRAMLRRDTAAFQPVQLNEVLGEVLRLARADLIARGVMVECQFEEDLPQTLGDRVQLQQVALNLILNAAQAANLREPGHRRIYLVTRRSQSHVRATVRDTGPGLPAGREGLFTPFVTTKQSGLGMGLTICHSIVTHHNGRIWAADHPEGGAVFHFELPAATGEVQP